MRFALPALLSSILLFAGCGVGDADVGSTDSDELGVTDTDAAPLLGVEGSGDSADRLCNVVLRNVSQASSSTGLQTACTTTKCWYVWNGTFDVAKDAIASGAKAYVLFESTSEPGHWYKATAAKVTGGATGFQRYKFKLSTHTIEAGVTASALERSAIQLVPYVLTTDGARHFDHNRVVPELGSYQLTNSNGFGVGDASLICQPAATRATVFFPKSGEPQLFGNLRPGGALAIQYDVDRMTTCRNTHNGYPAWDLTAFAMFDPSSQIASSSVRAFESHFGTPTNVSYSVPFHTVVPNDATGVQLWFQNQSGAGSTCVDWDSLGGKNYRFSVSAQ